MLTQLGRDRLQRLKSQDLYYSLVKIRTLSYQTMRTNFLFKDEIMFLPKSIANNVSCQNCSGHCQINVQLLLGKSSTNGITCTPTLQSEVGLQLMCVELEGCRGLEKLLLEMLAVNISCLCHPDDCNIHRTRRQSSASFIGNISHQDVKFRSGKTGMGKKKTFLL